MTQRKVVTWQDREECGFHEYSSGGCAVFSDGLLLLDDDGDPLFCVELSDEQKLLIADRLRATVRGGMQ